MRRVWRANRLAIHRCKTTSACGPGNNQVRARRPQSPLQVHHRTAHRQRLRFSPDVGIERIIVCSVAKGLSRCGANCVRSEGQLPHQCSGSSVVAVRHSDVRSHQYSSPADEHVQPAHTRTVCRETLRVSEVRRVLGGHRNRRNDWKLLDHSTEPCSWSTWQFHLSRHRRSFSGSFWSAVRIGGRALRVWYQVSP